MDWGHFGHRSSEKRMARRGNRLSAQTGTARFVGRHLPPRTETDHAPRPRQDPRGTAISDRQAQPRLAGNSKCGGDRKAAGRQWFGLKFDEPGRCLGHSIPPYCSASCGCVRTRTKPLPAGQAESGNSHKVPRNTASQRRCRGGRRGQRGYRGRMGPHGRLLRRGG